MLDIQFGKRSFTTQQKKSMGRWKVLGNIYHVQNSSSFGIIPVRMGKGTFCFRDDVLFKTIMD